MRPARTAPSVPPAHPMLMTTLRIENMHCAACIRRVTQALNSLPNARVEEVQLGTARVETSASPTEILAAMQKTGFPAHVEP